MSLTVIDTIKSFLKGPGNTLGVDVGSYAVKVISLSSGGSNGRYKLNGWGYLPLEIETSFEQSQAELRTVYTAKLQTFLSQNRNAPRDTTTGVDGPALIVRTISIPKLTYQELAKTIQFEAEPFLPVNINECEIGFHILGTSATDPKKMDVLIAAVKKDAIENKVNLLNEAGLRTVVVDANAFALANAYYETLKAAGSSSSQKTKTSPSAPTKDDTIIILNIGATITNMILIDKGTVKLVRDLAYGGSEFTKAVQRQMTVDFKGAENLKMSYGILLSEQEKEKTLADDKREALSVSMALNGTAKMLISDIHRFIEFYLGQNPEAIFSRILVSGGTALMPNLVSYIAHQTNIRTEVFNPIAICCPETAALIPEKYQPSLATAFGLSLRREKDHLIKK